MLRRIIMRVDLVIMIRCSEIAVVDIMVVYNQSRGSYCRVQNSAAVVKMKEEAAMAATVLYSTSKANSSGRIRERLFWCHTFND